MNTVERIVEHRIIAIARTVPAQWIVPIGEALCAGGIRLMEVTFDHTNADGAANTLEAIRLLREDGRMLVGAGTVLTPGEVEQAVSVGAEYIISPDMNPAVIARTKELGKVAIPGCMTPTEIATAARLGADFVKLFPASCLGSAYVKAVRGPLGHIPLLATGGVNPDNIGEFLRAGCVGAGVGGNLVSVKLARAGAFGEITEIARSFTDAIRGL